MKSYSLIVLSAFVLPVTILSYPGSKEITPQFNVTGVEQKTEHNTKSKSDTMKKRDLVVTRVFDAPVETVWKAWSDPKFIMKWWGPTGFTSPSCKMEFREGGTTLVCMRAPKEFGGQDMFNTWTYKKIIPGKFIEYIFDWADKDGKRIDPSSIGLPPGMPRDMRHIVVFRDLGNGKTEMTMTEFGYESDQIIDLSKAGLDQCLDKMAAIFRVNKMNQ